VPSETAQDGDTWESLAAWLEQVASEINNTLQFAKRIGLIRDSTQPVVIAGEIANIDGVQSKLAQSLSLPVTRWRSRFATSRTADSFNNHASVDASMAVAISLAFLAANSRGALT
jgi:Tfp pilus assembly PilM family ATPase